ncbi:hypothetical protein [Aestuariimicrobium sp. Y1814]|uniref:hypothetical protein n=1 Tax=Aestuariimicrobium sp. Y1814 TaxID=3418742 RepID=UPI003DA7A535
MTQWVDEWKRLEAVAPVAHGPSHAHELLLKGFQSLGGDERAAAVRAIGNAVESEDRNQRSSALWLVRRLELSELLPELRELAARLGQRDQSGQDEAVRVQRLIDHLAEVAPVSPADFEDELDRLTTRILMPLRPSKTLDVPALAALRGLVAASRRDGLFDDQIQVRLAGKLWFVFSAMLAEAHHAHDPEPILREAHRYDEVPLRAFGI